MSTTVTLVASVAVSAFPVRSPTKPVEANILVPLTTAAEFAPITVPSILPPSISTLAKEEEPVDVTSPLRSPEKVTAVIVLVDVRFLIPVTSLLLSRTTTLSAEAVPGATPER